MFRILTEDVNREAIFKILDARINGYTVTPALGVWKGQHENSLAIDVVGYTGKTVKVIAEEIKAVNKQESVLVLCIPSETRFV
jgi:hypothetical protein